VSSAFYWTYPKADSPVTSAFRAYRNFDGKGGRFLDFAVPARAANGDPSSVFVSRDEAGTHVVLVLLNFAPDSAARASVVLDGCGAVQSRSAFTYAGGASGLTPVKEAGSPGASIEEILAPYSITVVDLHLQTPAPGALEK
jgi:hypothetical protein